MAIARFENIQVNNLTFGKSAYGEQTTTQTKWFDTRARVASVANSVRISEKYRFYNDLVEFTLNYTPNMKTIIDNQNLYSFRWRGQDWRITNCQEADDRMTVRFMCFRGDPTTAV